MKTSLLAAKGPVLGTKGRAFDRIGLKVKNVGQKCKDFEAAGIKLARKGPIAAPDLGKKTRALNPRSRLRFAGDYLGDGAYRKATSMNLAVCVPTDPWGTYIEISEGLAAVK